MSFHGANISNNLAEICQEHSKKKKKIAKMHNIKMQAVNIKRHFSHKEHVPCPGEGYSHWHIEDGYADLFQHGIPRHLIDAYHT